VLEIYRSMLLRISDALAQDVERARAALAQVLGTVTVRGTDERLWAEVETRPEAVLLSAGARYLWVWLRGKDLHLTTLGLGGRVHRHSSSVDQVAAALANFEINAFLFWPFHCGSPISVPRRWNGRRRLKLSLSALALWLASSTASG
jgi:hypothetical protein